MSSTHLMASSHSHFSKLLGMEIYESNLSNGSDISPLDDSESFVTDAQLEDEINSIIASVEVDHSARLENGGSIKGKVEESRNNSVSSSAASTSNRSSSIHAGEISLYTLDVDDLIAKLQQL